MAGGRARGEHVGRRMRGRRQMMETIGVVPEQPEVGRGRRHRGGPPHRLGRIDRTGRIAVQGHAPDTLDRGIVAHLRLDEIEIRTVVAHRHVDHADPERRADREVAIVARHRAQERDLAPRRTARHAEQRREHERVVHQFEARIAHRRDLRRRDVEQRGAELARLRQAERQPVVAAVDAVARQMARRARRVEARGREIELLGRGLAPRHVQAHPQLHEGFVRHRHSPALRPRAASGFDRPSMRAPLHSYKRVILILSISFSDSHESPRPRCARSPR